MKNVDMGNYGKLTVVREMGLADVSTRGKRESIGPGKRGEHSKCSAK